jgi:endonuclease/exonuclease/phosphatase family metal-dependent hydrolase
VLKPQLMKSFSIVKSASSLVFALLAIVLTAKLANAEKIRVLNFNTWGVPFAVWDKDRYAKAMSAIEKYDPDFVVLEEVFSDKGRRAFKSDLYPYVANGPGFFPRLLGSGLRILSKYPFNSVITRPYHECIGVDCLAHKGSALVEVTLPCGKTLSLLGTHLDANENAKIRVSEIDELKKLVDSRDPTTATLIVGDFNFGPSADAYRYAKEQLQVTDSWVETHSAEEPGLTYDIATNHYAHDYCIKTHDQLIQDRFDLMFHSGAITPLSSTVIFNTEDSLFSDHYGLLSEFEI